MAQVHALKTNDVLSSNEWCHVSIQDDLLVDRQELDCCGLLRLTDASVMAIAEHNVALEYLGLHCCRAISDAAMVALASSRVGTTLINLNVSGNLRLRAPAVQALLDVSQGLHTCSLGRNINIRCVAMNTRWVRSVRVCVSCD